MLKSEFIWNLVWWSLWVSHTIADAGNQGHAQNWKYDQIDHLGNGMLPGLSPPDIWWSPIVYTESILTNWDQVEMSSRSDKKWVFDQKRKKTGRWLQIPLESLGRTQNLDSLESGCGTLNQLTMVMRIYNTITVILSWTACLTNN